MYFLYPEYGKWFQSSDYNYEMIWFVCIYGMVECWKNLCLYSGFMKQDLQFLLLNYVRCVCELWVFGRSKFKIITIFSSVIQSQPVTFSAIFYPVMNQGSMAACQSQPINTPSKFKLLGAFFLGHGGIECPDIFVWTEIWIPWMSSLTTILSLDRKSFMIFHCKLRHNIVFVHEWAGGNLICGFLLAIRLCLIVLYRRSMSM